MVKRFIRNLKKEISLNLSTKNKLSIEISSMRSCSIRCSYCPQDLLIASSNKNKNSENLIIDKFSNYLDKLDPIKANIHWTGFVEPCLNKDLPEMLSYAEQKGFNQFISTTLVGHKSSIESVSNASYLKRVNLHLPDNDGLMENGSLKVNQNYLERLKSILDKAKSHKNKKIFTMTFGKDYHPLIKKILYDKSYESFLEVSKPALFVHTRAGVIDNKVFKGFIRKKILFVFLKKFKKKIIEIILSITPKINTFHCSYKRLNQPVLLGDGKLSICCMDYGLNCIIGDLNEVNNYELLYDKWLSNNLDKFISGKLSPCTKCEYYQKISLISLVMLYFRKYKKYLAKSFTSNKSDF